jgi:hypothetical protein
MHFLVLVQFGYLKLEDTRRRPEAKFTKRAYLWLDSRLVGPPASEFVLLRQGVKDALGRGFYGTFFDNG